jgi:hypothetical protein
MATPPASAKVAAVAAIKNLLFIMRTPVNFAPLEITTDTASPIIAIS